MHEPAAQRPIDPRPTDPGPIDPGPIEAGSVEHRHIEVTDGGQTIGAAEVTTPSETTARTSLHPPSGHVAPGSRASLVDAVLDLPEVRDRSRLEATVPLGDAESLERLRQRTEDAVTRPAGSTALLDATIPHDATQPPPRDNT